MRIGVNTLFLIPGEVGGSETYLRRTLVALKEHGPPAELVLFTNDENDAVLKEDLGRFGGVAFVGLGFAASNRFSRIVREQVQLPRAVARAGVDVLWSPGYTAPKRCACLQVVTILDMQYKHYPEDLTWLARLTTDKLVKTACRRCQGVLAISEFSKSEILRFTAAPSERVEVTPLGVEPAFGDVPAPAELQRRLAEAAGVSFPYLLCVANTYPHKNVHVAVSAFDRVARELPHHLVLVGKPRRGEPRLQACLAQSPFKDRIHRLRNVNTEILVALYQGADMSLFPSLYEGFGLPVLESMAAGTPVIAVRQTAVPEVGGPHARYVPANRAQPMADAILAWVSLGEEEKRAWRSAAREWTAQFTWAATARSTWLALKHAADRESGTA